MTPQTNAKETKPAPAVQSKTTAPERDLDPPPRLVERRRAPRGFAAMSADRQREVAGMGGRAAHRAGTAHEFTTEEAQAAGRKRRKTGSGSEMPHAEGESADTARHDAPDSSEGIPNSVA